MLKDINFMNIAYEIATWSKCVSRKTWAVIVKENRILSSGYNWTPAWYTNCNDFWKWEYTKDHHDWSYRYEIHAEMNAMIWAARKWIQIEWATLYSTYQPCFDCTRAILAAWIKRIVYKEKYKHYDWDDAEKFIIDCWWESSQVL